MTKKKNHFAILELRQSALFRLPSMKALANALKWRGTPSGLRSLCLRKDNYDEYDLEDQNGKQRHIESPKMAVKALQGRVNELLKRIAAPEYLQSGIPGRSYLLNSSKHMAVYGATATLDIEKYYPSVSQKRVYRLFRNVFGCESDVAWALAGLLCCRGHLATGSPASALVAFYACKDMFDLVAKRAAKADAVFTLYVDDIAITGRTIGIGDLASLEKLFARFGFRVKRTKSRLFRAKQCKIITGRAIRYGVSRAPNKKHYKLRLALMNARNSPEDLALLRSAIGLTDHLALLDPGRADALKKQAKGMRSRAKDLS